MPLQVIHIIRDMTDRGEHTASKVKSFCCSDTEAPLQVNWEPNTDIVECEDHVEIRMELAGVSRDQVGVFLKNGRLLVQGVRFEKKPQNPIYYHQLEWSYGSFAKIIPLPESIEHNDITATLDGGLLQIKISKESKVVEVPIISEHKSETDNQHGE
ncbi:Hsp20/alpha crystallin family protein [candidate division KSB1 bacterium]|nr:Hsp20/alpha crystallin family protein [candidate division KSB1 bacterium]